MKNDVYVELRGRKGAGKTTFAVLLTKFCEQHGIDVRFEGDNASRRVFALTASAFDPAKFDKKRICVRIMEVNNNGSSTVNQYQGSSEPAQQETRGEHGTDEEAGRASRRRSK